MFKTLFHLVAVVHFYYAVYYGIEVLQLPTSFSKTGQILGKFEFFKFLTNWDVVLQAVFFTVCLLNDLLGSNKEQNPKKPSSLRKLQDTLLPTLAFPVSLFVAATFWALYAIDRELILPRALDPHFPVWYNHVIHTNVIIFSTLELITSYRKYPSTKVAFSILQGFLVGYFVWSLILLTWTGFWVYPILNYLGWPARILFILGNTVCSVVFYYVGKFINDLRWGSVPRSQKADKSSSKNGRSQSKTKLKKQI